MGSAYSNLGEYHKAIGLFEQHLEIARRIGYAQGEGNALDNMGNAYSNLGEYEKAIGLFEQHCGDSAPHQGCERRGQCPEQHGHRLYANLASTTRRSDSMNSALEIARRIRDVKGEGNALMGIGNNYALIGDKEKAAQAFAQCKAIYANLGLLEMLSAVDEIMKRFGI